MIRQLALHDVPACVDLGKYLHAESNYAFLNYSPEKVARLLANCVTDQNYFGCVAEVDGQPVGFCLGFVSEYFLNHELIASDYAVFVSKEHRQSSIGAELISSFVEWAKTKGCREVCMGISTGVHTDKTKRLYERLEFTEVGVIMKKRLS